MNPHDRLRSADFKSAVSADFTIAMNDLVAVNGFLCKFMCKSRADFGSSLIVRTGNFSIPTTDYHCSRHIAKKLGCSLPRGLPQTQLCPVRPSTATKEGMHTSHFSR